MEHSQLEALKARLAELEREKAALRTHIKTISELPEGFSVTSGRQGPRLRAPAVPEEWLEMHPERVANLPRGAEVLTRAGVQVVTDAPPPPPGASADFAPPPDGVTIKQSVAPDYIHRSSFVHPTMPSAMSTPLPSASRNPVRTYLGASAFNRSRAKERRSRLNPVPASGSSRAKAIFLVVMVVLLGYLAIRAFT
ncbi:MAG: hypothetical protein ILO10_07850 [Kiritimatiellae bacterium]|nr:hypothetical protein [Kiritimatiellia bacterium]